MLPLRGDGLHWGHPFSFRDFQSMTLRRVLLAAALPLALAAPALARSFANPDPSAVKPGAYAIEPTHTRVLFSVSHMGFTTWYGNFTDASGSLVLDPAHPDASHLDVTIPIASVSTTNAKLDDELKSPAWFDAAKYPTASFHSTAVHVTGRDQAEIDGELTLHGVTKPVVLTAAFNGAGVNPIDQHYTAGFEVRGEIKRSDFGVSKYVPVVGDDVKLIISAAFEKAPG
jgi:polyisoprenoid-binding protein YceI